MHRLAVPDNIWKLCYSYFQDRTASIEIGGSSACKPVTIGCPQGSTGGPSFWNILYDDLLNITLPNGCELIAFADDLVLVCSAAHEINLQSIANTSIDRIVEWGTSNKLKFNESKTNAMLITRIRRSTCSLIMNGNQLDLVNECKYLGIYIDRKLNWRRHINYLETKTAAIYNRMKMISSNVWGVKSDVAKTLYIGIVEPTLVYACNIWGQVLEKKWAIEKITRIQRWFLLSICKAYRTVPHLSLCAIAGICPIDIRIKQLNAIASSKNSSSYINEFGNIALIEPRFRRSNCRHPAISYNKFICTPGQPFHSTTQIEVYTDGSKMDSGTGLAFVIFINGVEFHHYQLRLNNDCSIFQAELIAIQKCLTYLINNRIGPSNIFSDSLSSLMAILNRESDSPIVNDIQQLLIQLENFNIPAVISWVKGHSGVHGNERADELAKLAIDSNTISDACLPPLSIAKKLFKQRMLVDWNCRWASHNKGRFTYQFLPDIAKRLHIDFNTNFSTTQFITDHGFFKSYLKRMALINDDNCSCGHGAMSAEHLMFHCPLTEDLRLRFSGMARSDLLNHNTNIIPFMDAVGQIFDRFNQGTATIH